MEPTPRDSEMIAKLQNYRKIVLIYEGLNREIDKLLTANAGRTENMSDKDLGCYLALAHQRDELFSEMRTLERQLLEDDSDIDKDL